MVFVDARIPGFKPCAWRASPPLSRKLQRRLRQSGPVRPRFPHPLGFAVTPGFSNGIPDEAKLETNDRAERGPDGLVVDRSRFLPVFFGAPLERCVSRPLRRRLESP